MNCQYCGKKIGIIENWRYGRFCSKEHQDEFRDEATRLAASVLGARPPGGDEYSEDRQQAFNPLSKQKSPAGEPVQEVDPPRMEAVGQEGASAVEWKPKPAAVSAEGRDRAANERHQRLLRILAANDRTPPPVLEKDRRRRLKIEDDAFRFGEVEAPGARSVLVPPSGAVQKRPKLQFCERLLPLGGQEEAQAALPEFECLWDGGGEWNLEAAGPAELDYGDYLEDYTPEQPWEQWDWNALLDEAKYAQSMNEERDRRLNRLRSQQPAEQAQQKTASAGRGQPGAPAMPVYPGRMPASQQPAQCQRAMPALNLAPAGTGGRGGTRSGQPPGRPGMGGQGGAAQAAGSAMSGGMVLPAMPSYPGRMVLRPAGGAGSGPPGPGGEPGAGAPGPGPLVRIAAAMGMQPVEMEWVELAPPLFLALCRIDEPLPLNPARQTKAVEAVRVDMVGAPGEAKPGFAGAIAPARMPDICCDRQPAPEPRRVAPPEFVLKDSRPDALDGEHAQSLPVHCLPPGRFRVPRVPAGDRRSINLRPLAGAVRPNPVMSLDDRRAMTG